MRQAPPSSPPSEPLTFRLGVLGALLPVVLFLGGVGWLGFSGAPDERGLWPVLLVSLGLGLVLSRDSSKYSSAVIRGMARPIVMLMVMAWLLAGVFSVLLRESGLIHSLIWLAGEAGLSGGTFVVAVLFISMLFATATGTSLGTIIICAPLLYPASGVLESQPEMVMGAILAGATFGDNISPVSDTTIASANSQEAPMGGVVRSRLKYAVPAALVAALVFLALGGTGTTLERTAGRIAAGAHPANLSGDPVALPMLLAPMATFLMLWRRKGLLESLFVGVAAATLLALAMGLIGVESLIFVDKDAFRAQGLILDGMESSIGIVVFTLLLMGVVGALEETGILERLLDRDAGATGPRGAELRIFGLTSAAVLLTTHSVVAILAAGDMVKRIGLRAGIGRFRRANLMDTTVCTYPFLLPFFIPTILASSSTMSGESFGVPALTAFEVGLRNAYSWALLAVILIAIGTGWGRTEKTSTSAGGFSSGAS